MKKSALLVLILFTVLLLLWLFIRQKSVNKPLRLLPFYGPKNYSGGTADSSQTAHTIYYFKLTNQFNEPYTLDSVKGKIYVSEFFFTTCRSICPIMNRNLEKVYARFGQRPDFKILSHTVDPETDSAAVLLEYARQHGVRNRNWIFLTGNKKALYEAARKSYLVSVDEKPPENPEDDFIHTQMFVLVDKNLRIRGYYDGTDSTEVSRLMTDIEVLYKEYENK
ncbi:MAG: SCO family protein [Bacteroidia bacterium]|nr:SCO family protein [Bacteroidia bacterium]